MHFGPKKTLAWLICICASGLVLRLSLLYSINSVVDGDEAIVGLMAKHIVDGGRDWPVFYYGQPYMGSLEPTLVAILFGLFGVSSFFLKLVPTVFSVIHIFLMFVLTRKLTNTYAGICAAIFTAVCPTALTLWSTKARGGFIELVVLGTLSLIITFGILSSKKDLNLKKLFLLGLVLGLGWWVNNQIVFYIAPIGLVLLIFILRNFLSRIFWSFLSGTIGFFTGGLPFWIENLTSEPRFQSFGLFKTAGGTSVVEHLSGYFTTALPIIFGARKFWSEVDIFPFATGLSYLLYLTAVFFLIRAFVVQKDKRYEFGLLICFLMSVPAIFSLSQYGWLSQAPRYLLPLYSVLPLILGLAVSELKQGSLKSNAFLAVVVVFNAAGNLMGSGAQQGQPVVYMGERVKADHTELYKWLETNNIKQISTNYWIGYRIAFDTKEKAIFNRFRGPKELRIPEYELKKERELENQIILLTNKEADHFTTALSAMGYLFRRQEVGGYSVVDSITFPQADLEQILIQPEQITYFLPDGTKIQPDIHPSRLIDGQPWTRWGTSAPQEPGMQLLIKLPQEPSVAGLDIDLGFWIHDAPKKLAVELVDPSGGSCTLLDTAAVSGFGYLTEDQRVWKLRFPPRKASFIRLISLGSHPIFDWSMAEIKLYKERNNNI